MTQGRISNLGALDYRIPTTKDVPLALEALSVENADGPGPYGSKGVSEGALLCTAPALAAALTQATGVFITDLPMTPERVWRAMRDSAARDQRKVSVQAQRDRPGASMNNCRFEPRSLSSHAELSGRTAHGVWKTHEEAFVDFGYVQGNAVMYFSMADHGGTHMDAPRHFGMSGTPDRQISAGELHRPRHLHRPASHCTACGNRTGRSGNSGEEGRWYRSRKRARCCFAPGIITAPS